MALASTSAAWAESASPPATETTPSVMDDVLRIWNQAPATDAGDNTPNVTAASQWYNVDDDETGSDDVTPSYRAPDGSSLTPNLDRLLQRAGQPLVPSDGIGLGVGAPSTDPNAFTASPFFEKGGQSWHQPPRCNPPPRPKRRCRPHYQPPCPPRPPGCPPPTPTPEPGTLLLFGAAAATVTAARRRRASLQA